MVQYPQYRREKNSLLRPAWRNKKLDRLTKTILFAVIVVVAGIVTVLIINLKRASAADSPATHNRAARMLRRFARSRGWKVIDTPVLETASGTFTTGHLLLCPYGAVAIGDLHRRGNYYGDLDGVNWVISTGDAEKMDYRTVVPSPYRDVLDFNRALRRQVEINKVYFTQYESLLACSKGAFVCITGSRDAVFTLRNLKKRLSGKKYAVGKADIEALAALPGLSSGKKK